MGLREDAKLIAEDVKSKQSKLEHNAKLLDIYEGNLLEHVLAALKCELSPESFEEIKHRAAPINVLIRLIDKLSKIYSKPPTRTLIGGSDSDQKLWDYYSESMSLNVEMPMANEYFNLFKSCALEPYLDSVDGKEVPRLRVLPVDRFTVLSTNESNPLKPTYFTKLMGKRNGKDLYYAYSADEFLAIDQNGEPVMDIMRRPDVAALNGANPFGAIPAVYVNRSRNLLTPLPDTDTMAMTVLIPILLSDLNYAHKYMSFSMTYGINLDMSQDAGNLKRAPNAMWLLKQDKDSDGKPEVGVIKPQVDIEQSLSLVRTELSMWLQNRSIKPGAIGDMTVENASSGISKIIDEMDTSEDRTKQVPYFVQAERDLFNLITKNIHPVWSQSAFFERKGEEFSKGLGIEVKFPEQRPLVSDSQQIDDQDRKIQMRIESRRGALAALNPDWTDEQLDDKLAEVDAENVEIKEPNHTDPNQDASNDGANI